MFVASSKERNKDSVGVCTVGHSKSQALKQIKEGSLY
jgi:hypothetical protein